MPYPKAIANAPALRVEDVFYFNAYHELCTCRAYEGGFIPWTAIKAYAVHCGQDDDEFEDLKNVVLTLDGLMRATATGTPDKGEHLGR